MLERIERNDDVDAVLRRDVRKNTPLADARRFRSSTRLHELRLENIETVDRSRCARELDGLFSRSASEVKDVPSANFLQELGT